MWELVLALVVLVAFVFLLTNGMNDASAVVATMIACGAATPLQAVLWAASVGLVGAIFSGAAVAQTIIGLLNVPVSHQLLLVLLAGLTAAMIWNLFTWKLGIPSSSTHSLVGGLVGGAWAAYGASAVVWGWTELYMGNAELVGVAKIVASLIISPALGFLVAFIVQMVLSLAFRRATFWVNKPLKRSQWLLSGILAYGHGANDAQKMVGIISLALLASGVQSSVEGVPTWVKVACGLIMFFGTLFGGWSIMKTLGTGIFTLRPLHSFNSQFSAGASVALATFLGAPVSTTHIVSGTVIGAGAADNYRMVNWNVGKHMLVAWCVTIPASALCAAGVYRLLQWLTR